ncbi:type I-B CRISPR-associated protein Cas7/Csh2 [Tunicatimonas pelagia]|uniref:type I-B CRISPR-associated protein Cas7/Csh2 n=1 Tax=Tunicatimonas pelagia TaxID=931531 RepID=UPI00266625C1|nr:type I-B CRISPR-associated protein Cas7/Csh2 [Tunicatimonas pelagia]WKN44270.1 type I-B CRISPR-associated protein Cas7/Csh2 [Tunicatimonas pelagia]
MPTIKNRTELLFLYEIENTNPNGDPLNENRPRFDSEENKVLVSDVRLKRTIRDYWFEYKGYNGENGNDIFVRETKYEKGGLNDAKERAKAFSEKKEVVLEKCIDIRVFGGVLPLKNDSLTFTGPTQFQMGKSLHPVEVVTEQGTGAFASTAGKGQATFRTEYKIPYAVIGFNGIINEKAAQYTLMSEEDKKLLTEGIWEGTKNLISRSKFGQNPLLLLSITYKEPFYIGGLRQRLKLKAIDKSDLQIRSLTDFSLALDDLIDELKSYQGKIDNIEIKLDRRLQLTYQGNLLSLQNGKVTLNAIS